jgi:hypothetical protein
MKFGGSPMRIELRCRICGQEYTPSRDDILAGPEVYHRCPSCRIERLAQREEAENFRKDLGNIAKVQRKAA